MQQIDLNKPRKRLALALSGSSGRAVAMIGMLEVLEENSIPVDAIAACSSSTLVACAYASGRLEQMKEKYFSLSKKELLDLFEPSFKGGMFSLDRAGEAIDEFLSAENIEQLNIPVAIVASDLIQGEEVIFRMGNILRAIKASCSVPGLFEPVVWGDRILIDGGLLSYVPTNAAKTFGADVVIGVDMALTRNAVENNLIRLKRGFNILRWPFNQISKYTMQLKNRVFGEKQDAQVVIDQVRMPSFLSVLGRAIDIALAEREKEQEHECDLMIKPGIQDYGRVDVESAKEIYEEGRRVALDNLPKIKKLLELD